jgi:plasmid stability protein
MMENTTVYLPADLKQAVKVAARRRGVSEATVIRDSLRATVATDRPRPRAGLFASGDPMAERVDELLAGFGER